MLAHQQPSDIRIFRSLDFSRLWIAFVISVVLHLVIYGTYKGGQKLGLWERLHWKPMGKVIEELQEARIAIDDPDRQPPLMFVDVNPAATTTDVPDDTQYYSDKSSRASNPLTDELSEVPMFDGSQENIVRTDDVAPLNAVPLQPASPPAAPESKPAPREDPVQEDKKPEGDLLMANAAEPKERQEPKPPEPKPRPRTLKEAMARMPQTQVDKLAGRKMKQEGGAKRLNTLSTLDVKGSPFGEYDRAIIVAIQNRWFDLLDMRGFGHEKSGRVVLEFRLHYDGRISMMTVAENSVDEMLSEIRSR